MKFLKVIAPRWAKEILAAQFPVFGIPVINAQVAELVDALVSGTSESNLVEVQVLS